MKMEDLTRFNEIKLTPSGHQVIKMGDSKGFEGFKTFPKLKKCSIVKDPSFQISFFIIYK